MQWQPSRRLTLKYYAFVVTGSESVVNPILTLYLLSRGLSYTTIGVVTATWWAAWVVSEIPTGYVGDRVGRRTSLLVGTGLKAVALLGFGLSSSVAALAAFNALWAVGITFRTGSLSAWLYDVLQARYDEDEFAHVQGRGSALALSVGIGGSLLGGYLGGIDYTYPFVITAGLTVLGIPVVLSFPRSRTDDGDDPDDGDDSLTTLEAVALLRREFATPPLRSFVVYTGVLSGTLWMVYSLFVQPISVEVGLREAHLGVVYAGFTATSAAAGYFAGDVRDRFGVDAVFVVAPVVVGGLFLLVGLTPLAALPAFFVMQATDRLTRVLRNQYINDRVGSAGRATVLSTASMVFGLIAFPFEIAAGALADLLSPTLTVASFGGLLVVVSAAVLLVEPPVSVGSVVRARTAD